MNERQAASDAECDEVDVPAGGQSVSPTGVPNLDLVLGGGLPRRSLVIVVGPPGSGKTTLANQIAFATARNGQQALILTALSEPTNKLIEHLRTFRFFDSSLVGERVEFLSLQQFLPRGLEATADELLALTRHARAKLVVLDGFRGVRGADVDPQAARQFLYDVGTKLSVLGATTVITSEADPRDPTFFPEATTADVIIGLHYDLVGARQQRGLEVVKVRGAQLLPGLHSLRLGPEGIVVYPRLESQIAAHAEAGEPEDTSTIEDLTAAASEDRERVPFGLPELDRLLGGGVPGGTSTLVVGSLGTGKTLLGLHFALTSIRAGEPTLFLGFRENLRQLLRKADAFALGTALRAAVAPGGGLTVQRWPAVDLNPEIVADRLLAAIDRTGARRLVVDGAAELQHAVASDDNAERVSDYLAALVEALHARHMTTLFVSEHPKVVAAQLDFSADPISVLAENVLLLQQVHYRAQLHRVLSVVKMRYSAHDYMLREFTITAPEGIRVLDPFESGEGLLAGIARQQGVGDAKRARRRRGNGAQDTNRAGAEFATPGTTTAAEGTA